MDCRWDTNQGLRLYVDDGLQARAVRDLAFFKGDSVLDATTSGEGVFGLGEVADEVFVPLASR